MSKMETVVEKMPSNRKGDLGRISEILHGELDAWWCRERANVSAGGGVATVGQLGAPVEASLLEN